MDLSGCVDNMLSPHVVAAVIQSTEVVPRGPQHWTSGWLLLSWPCLVVATDRDDRSMTSTNAIVEAAVDDTVYVVHKLPHWQLSAAWVRSARAPPLRISAMVP